MGSLYKEQTLTQKKDRICCCVAESLNLCSLLAVWWPAEGELSLFPWKLDTHSCVTCETLWQNLHLNSWLPIPVRRKKSFLLSDGLISKYFSRSVEVSVGVLLELLSLIFFFPWSPWNFMMCLVRIRDYDNNLARLCASDDNMPFGKYCIKF